MDISVFRALPEHEDLSQAKLKVGDFFLHGPKIILQKDTKEIGQPVTFYEVINITEKGNLEFVYRTEKLTGIMEGEN